jgi:hypothetical protein
LKTQVLAVVLLVLLANVALYDKWVSTDETDNGWLPDDVTPIVTPISNVTVHVPAKRAGDIMQYDYYFFAEIYSINMTSGNWSRITLRANGQRLDSFPGVSSQKDGFNQAHDTYQTHTELRLSVTLTSEQYSPGQSSQPLILTGRIEGERDKYATLRGDVPIQSYAAGLLKIDDIKGFPTGLAMTSFELDMSSWGYPDPNIEPEIPLEERLYANSAPLEVGMRGNYSEHQADWGNYSQVYNWSVDGADRVRGHDCVRLNITPDFMGFFNFSKVLWLSNDMPAPVRVVYNSTTYMSYYPEYAHIIINSTQTLQEGGYIKGGSVIDVRPTATEPFVKVHPSADLRSWDYGPEDGSLSSGSFELGLDEALDYARANSAGLSSWLGTHPNARIGSARYSQNTTDQPINAEEYIWNITLAGEPGDWEDRDLWYPSNAYQVNVSKHIERRPVLGDRVTMSVKSEAGPRRGQLPYTEPQLPDEMLTLASTEAIWSQVPQIADRAYTGITNDVDWSQSSYSYDMGGIDPTGFGLDILDTLVGVSIPTARITWSMQLGTVWEGASTYVVGLDAETGRLLFISDVSGPVALSMLFGM